MSKITYISDTHGSHNELNLKGGDILVHCGDFTSQGEYTIKQDFNTWLGKQDYSYKIVIAGNHELTMEKFPILTRKLITNATYLEEESIVIEGLKFYGSPYTPAFFNWAFNVNSNEIYKHWEKIPQDTQILITHGPPYKILDKNGDGDHCGDKSIMYYINKIKPLHVAFGHIHSGHGTITKNGTKFINASILDNSYNLVYDPIEVKI